MMSRLALYYPHTMGFIDLSSFRHFIEASL